MDSVWTMEALLARPARPVSDQRHCVALSSTLSRDTTVQPDFLYSVSRDFMRTCHTPILVLPDDIPAHPLQTSIDVASLAPHAEITVYPWKEPAELKQRTIDRVRRFLQAHVPLRAAAH